MEESSCIQLQGGETFLTDSEADAFLVKKGPVLVYIVPLNHGEKGRRAFIYEAKNGEVIPGFCYRDMDYIQWRFCFSALEEATLERIENGNTKVLRERFSQKAKIKNYAIEGFEEGLVDQYRIITVTEDSFIIRSQKDRETKEVAALQLIHDSFCPQPLEKRERKSGSLLYDAVDMLCRGNNISLAPYEVIEEACGDDFTVSDIARISHIAYREIILGTGWERKDGGAFLILDQEQKPHVCLPKGSNSYLLYDPGTDSTVRVTGKVAESLPVKAYMFYRALPSKRLSLQDIIGFCCKSVRCSDVVLLTAMAILCSLTGILLPVISRKIYDEFIPVGAIGIILQMGVLLFSFMISNALLTIVRNISGFRIESRMAYDMQNAVYGRLFNLPETFFNRYESADLAQRVMSVGNTVFIIASVSLSSFIHFIYLIACLVGLISFSGRLATIGFLLVLVSSAGFCAIGILAEKQKKKSAELEGKTSSLLYQYISGISKIRISGVEDSALLEYLKSYVPLRNSEEKKNKINGFITGLTLAVNGAFYIVLYLAIVKGYAAVSTGTVIAFLSLFGIFSSCAHQLADGVMCLYRELPGLERIRPVFDEEPELEEGKELPRDLSGAIEISNVSFSYQSDMPNILENINIIIQPGEYVGIVGPSGCGKSTLMKLLLGFEKPNSGKIYYDSKDLESVDKRELRKQVGVVLQDGKLISGSIYENIVITEPKATMDDVREVIRAVGLEQDISEMPMGLHTILSEDCGTISGGQQQRILIGRAIIANPAVLFLDEATSALDNITQNAVCRTLEAMRATKVVIAHRLSTVMKCDRIIVMDAGRIVEQGTYKELMAREGLFYRLAGRQMAE